MQAHKLFFAIIAIAICNQLIGYSTQALFQANDDKWTFIEHSFVTSLEQKKEHTTLRRQVAHALVGLTVAVAHTTQAKDEDFKELFTAQNGVKALIGLTIYKIAHELFCCYYTNQLYKNSLIDFLTDWEMNKNLTPDELIPFFEELSVEYAIDADAVVAKASEIVGLIRFLVYRHFESRYEDELTITRTTTNDVKTGTDLLKNLVGTAKDILK